MALAEAMLYGCVPVTTGAGGMREVTGDLGFRVLPDDAPAVARIVLAGVPERSVHEACARRIKERFPMGARASGLDALFGVGASGGTGGAGVAGGRARRAAGRRSSR